MLHSDVLVKLTMQIRSGVSKARPMAPEAGLEE